MRSGPLDIPMVEIKITELRILKNNEKDLKHKTNIKIFLKILVGIDAP